MSTELKTNHPGYTLTRYFGGTEDGMCIQVTMSTDLGPQYQYIQLTREEAWYLSQDLSSFALDLSLVKE